MVTVKEKEIPHSSETNVHRVTYLGEKGSFSHNASLQYFGPDMDNVPLPGFRDIFQEVSQGGASCGIIPIENTLCGSIHENYDLLLEYDLHITGEISTRIVHNLITQPGVSLNNIRRVLGPTPALQQCRKFLDNLPGVTLVPVNATAIAVKTVAESISQTDAAIGSLEAANVFSMSVLKNSIEDNPSNYTRFVIIEKNPLKNGPKNKSSVVFSTPNEPGSLLSVMKVISEYGINLVKLESRPIHGKPWQYMFYADLETDISAPDNQDFLKTLKKKTNMLKTLGSYPIFSTSVASRRAL